MKQEIRTCYITAPAGVKLDILQRTLEHHNIRVVSPAYEPGAEWQNLTQNVLATVDLVIGVLTHERRSQWVLFELGQASALHRRLLLIAPPKTNIPSNLQRIQVLRTSLDNEQALDFTIAQLKVAPLSGTSRSELPIRQTPVPERVETWLAELNQIGAPGEGRELENFVAKLFQEIGVEFVREARQGAARVDFAIWSDVLQSSMGNPLIVEVKRSFADRRHARDAITRFSKAIASAGANWGLLLYASAPENSSKLWQSVPPNVLVISLPELLRAMRDRSFEAVIRDLRNRRVHGSSL